MTANAAATPAAHSSLELCPWMVPITDSAVICKDGALLACYEFTGADLDGSEASLKVELANAVDRFGQQLRDKPITLWWTVRRERSEAYPAGQFRNPVSAFLDAEHKANLLAESSFRNRHFLSLLWVPETGASTIFDRISALIGDGMSIPRAIKLGAQAALGSRTAYAFRAAEVEQELREFEALLPRFEAVLYPTHLRRLAGPEMLGFLWAMANPGLPLAPKTWGGVGLLDGVMMERPLTVTKDALRFGDGASSTYASAISLKAPPAATRWAAVEGLLSAPCEMVLSQIFRVASTKEAEKHMNALRRTLELSKVSVKGWMSAAMNRGEASRVHVDASKEQDAAEAEAAKQEVLGGQSVFGWHNLTVMLLDSDLDRLDEITRATLRSLHSGAFMGATQETIHLLSSYASTLPGGWRACNRWLMLGHQNATDMAPLTGVSDGELVNEHLTKQLGQRCEALITFQTEYRTPYFFNFHAGALGHCAVLGPSRSGKTIGMNFAISQFNKYPNSRTLIFDKDYSCRIPSLLQGGKYMDLRPDQSIRMNPLLLLEDPAHWPFLQQWVEGLLTTRGYVITTEDARAIRDALQDISRREDRTLLTLGYLAEVLPTHLRALLDPWVGAGQHAPYFDNEVDDFDLGAPLTCIEMNHIMRVPVAARAFLEYAFYRLQLLLRSASTVGAFPTLIYIEEAWFLMQDPVFAARLMDWLKTFAKLNALVVLTTQSLEDLAALPDQIFAAVRDNIPTKLYLPNALAMSETAYPVYHNKFGLTDAQIAQIAGATPREDYLIVKPGVSRLAKLKLSARQVAALRSDQAAQVVFDRHYNPDEPTEVWANRYLNAMMESAA